MKKASNFDAKKGVKLIAENIENTMYCQAL